MFDDLDLGDFASALRLTGGDERLASELLKNDERKRAGDSPFAERGVPENPYNEPGENPYGRSRTPEPVVFDMPDHRVVAGQPGIANGANPYDTPEINAALDKVRPDPTNGLGVDFGQRAAEQLVDQPRPVTGKRSGIVDEWQNAYPSNENLGVAPVPKLGVDPRQLQQRQPGQLPPDVNQALASTGSSYRVPTGVDDERVYDRARDLPPTIDVNLDGNGFRPIPTTAGDGRALNERQAIDQAIAAQGRTQPPPQPYGQQRGEPQLLQRPDVQRAIELSRGRAPLPDIAPVNAGDSVRDLRNQVIDSGNTQIGLRGQRGDVAATGAAQQAQVLTGAADAQGQRNEAVLGRHNAMLERTDANREDAYRKVDEMREIVKQVPGEEKSKLRKAAEVLRMIPGLHLIGKPLLGLAKSNEEHERQVWQDKLGGTDAMRKADTEMNASEHSDMDHELAQQRQMAMLADAEKANRLEAIAQTAGSEDQRLAARIGMSELRDKMANQLIELKTGEEKKDTATAQKAEDAHITALLANVPDVERPDLAAKLGPRAVELLGGMQKNTSTVVGIGKDLAATEEAQARAAQIKKEAAGGRKLNESELKLQRQARGIKPDYEAMVDIAQKVAAGKADIPFVGIGPKATRMGASEEAQTINGHIRQLAAPLMYDASGAVISDDEAENKWAGWGFLSPDQKIRNRAPARLLAELEARVGSVDPSILQSAPETGPAATGPAATSPPYSPEEIKAEIARRRAQASR